MNEFVNKLQVKCMWQPACGCTWQCGRTCTALTMARVAVAMPDMRCRKLSATRSAVSRLRAGPRTCAGTFPCHTPSHETRQAASSQRTC